MGRRPSRAWTKKKSNRNGTASSADVDTTSALVPETAAETDAAVASASGLGGDARLHGVAVAPDGETTIVTIGELDVASADDTEDVASAGACPVQEEEDDRYRAEASISADGLATVPPLLLTETTMARPSWYALADWPTDDSVVVSQRDHHNVDLPSLDVELPRARISARTSDIDELRRAARRELRRAMKFHDMAALEPAISQAETLGVCAGLLDTARRILGESMIYIYPTPGPWLPQFIFPRQLGLVQGGPTAGEEGTDVEGAIAGRGSPHEEVLARFLASPITSPEEVRSLLAALCQKYADYHGLGEESKWSVITREFNLRATANCLRTAQGLKRAARKLPATLLSEVEDHVAQRPAYRLSAQAGGTHTPMPTQPPSWFPPLPSSGMAVPAPTELETIFDCDWLALPTRGLYMGDAADPPQEAPLRSP